MATGWHPIKVPHTNANLTHPFIEVTAYGPTSPCSTAKSSLKEDFYQQLQVAVDQYPERKWLCWWVTWVEAEVEKYCSTNIFLFRSMVKGKSSQQWWSLYLNFVINPTSSLPTAYINTPQDTSQPVKITSESQTSTNLFPSTIKLTTSQCHRNVRHQWRMLDHGLYITLQP